MPDRPGNKICPSDGNIQDQWGNIKISNVSISKKYLAQTMKSEGLGGNFHRGGLFRDITSQPLSHFRDINLYNHRLGHQQHSSANQDQPRLSELF